MKVRVSFFGPIRRPFKESSREIDIPEKSTIRAMLDSLGYAEDDMRRVAVVVAGKRRRLDYVLSEGDDVRFVLLAGGG